MSKPAKQAPPALSAKLIEDMGEALVKAVLEVQVVSVDDANRLAAMGKSLKAFEKMVTEDKERFCKPLNRISREYAAPRNAAIKALKPALAYVRDEPIRFAEKQAAAQRALLQSAAATGAGPREIEKAVALTVPDIEGHQVSEHWVAIVEDPARVPERYKMILQGELDREARAAKEKFNVPGCRAKKVKRGSIV